MGAPLKSKPERTCKNCGEKFIAVSYHQKFCSSKCSQHYHNAHRTLVPNVAFNCVVCGKKVEKYIEPSKQKIRAMKYCSRRCKGKDMSGSNHPMWNGGKRKNDQGYVLVFSPDHADADNKGLVREHRLVMENHIGRRLLREEVVHHENENTSDNRIENLILFKDQADHKKYHESKRTRNDKGRYERKNDGN